MFKKWIAKKKFQDMLPALKLIKARLEMSKVSKDYVFEIVNFFSYISRFQDSDIIKITLEAYQKANNQKITTLLSSLQKCIDDSGRNLHGLNRTKKFEEVTSDNVFLYDTSGHWVHPIRFFIKSASNEEYEALQERAKSYMFPRIETIIQVISELESTCQTRNQTTAQPQKALILRQRLS